VILRELPNLKLAPASAANADFRRWFYARWGRENAVVLGRSPRAEFAPYTQALSVKRAWGGREEYLLPGRTLAVDDEHYLVLDEGARYGARIASRQPVTSLAVFFRPGMAPELAAAMQQAPRALLDAGPECPRRPCAFAEHLRPLDAACEAALLHLRDAVDAAEDDEQWLEERLQELLLRLLRAEPGWRRRGERLAELGRTTHAELLARVDRATDFILSCHTRRLTLDDIAAAARLSKYHLVRVFREVHGLTPMALVARERTRTAARLLRDPALGLEDVAAASGFGSRQTLFRQLRRHRGDGGRALRARLSEDGSPEVRGQVLQCKT
jgi:AraC-like DNA-binding protein